MSHNVSADGVHFFVVGVVGVLGALGALGLYYE
jgi:hypothetical protein